MSSDAAIFLVQMAVMWIRRGFYMDLDPSDQNFPFRSGSGSESMGIKFDSYDFIKKIIENYKFIVVFCCNFKIDKF